MRLALTDYTTRPQRRLVFSLMLALVIHAALIVGIHSTPLPKQEGEAVSSLNVTLFKQADGKGTASPTETTSPPAKPPLSPLPPAPPQPLEQPPLEALEPPEPVAATTALKQADGKGTAGPTETTSPPAKPPLSPLPPAPPQPLEQPPPKPTPPSRQSIAPAPAPVSKPTPSAVDLMSKGLQMARTNPQLQPQTGNSREKYFNSQASSTVEDYYVMSWVRKVEQVGTLNFPEEARRRNLSGSLLLEVALQADGSVHSIRLIRSSGYEVLDKAARRIVELAAPYAAFPEEMRRQYDILHIRRTWHFLQGNRLQGR